MKSLFINTAKRDYALAAKNGEKQAFYKDNCQMPTSLSLFKSICSVCEQAGFEINQVEQVAVVLGPGSFTGSRLAVAVAKGLAFGGNVQLLCINSLELNMRYAQALKEYEKFLAVVPCVGGYCYAAAYDKNGNEIVAPHALKTEELQALATKLNTSPSYECAEFNFSLLKYFKKTDINIEPIYLRKSQAEEGVARPRKAKFLIFRVNKRRADIQQFAEIERQCFTQDAWSENMIQSLLFLQNSHFFAAKHNDIIIGYASMTIAQDEADINNIAVLADYRRQGVGKQLLESAIKAAKIKGIKNIFLEVRTSNKSAQALYEKSGFSVITTRTKYYSNGEDAFVMRLML